MKPCNRNIIKTLDLVEKMLLLADKGDEKREDDGCGILYGVLRDSAFKIENLAKAEKEAHAKKGSWED